MSLTGSRIGVFEVRGLLGAGGMGEVYRAHDTRLGRDVALKIVSPALAADPDHLRRLEREARILATLSHPNIAAIYGIEDIHTAGGPSQHALVLEFVDGEALDARIQRISEATGAGLAVADAVAVATQIAAALDAAHLQGIVHRDLKPGNVTITGDGRVKVLDFGIARAFGDADTSATVTGAALAGTPAYMSPEQARGGTVDRRTDIWAFGCVLFEMLTGRAAFARATLADTIAAVLSDEPDWTALPAVAPPALIDLLKWCLQRDVAKRLRDIGDAPLGAVSVAAPARVEGPIRDVRFQRLTDLPGLNEQPALSPDGRMVAFVSVTRGFRQIWVQLLSGGSPLQLTRGAAHHQHPRWLPDSGSLVYYTPPDTPGAEGTLWETPALGGTARPIAPSTGGGDPSHAGDRLAMFRLRDGLQQLITVRRDGSDERLVATMPRRSRSTEPRWSPDDRLIATTVNSLDQFSEELLVYPASGGPPRALASAGSLRGCAWLGDGSGLIYSSSAGSTLPYPRTCNLRRVTLAGADSQVTYGDMSHVSPDVSASGALVACRLRSFSDIWRIPVIGTPVENVATAIRVTAQTGQVQVPSVSPDGHEVVYLSDNSGHANLWITRADGSGDARQLTFERDPDVTVGVPLWSPAGRWIAFVRGSRGGIGIWIIGPDGRGARELVKEGFAACWSPDGRWVYCDEGQNLLASQLKKTPVDGGAAVIVRQSALAHGPVVGDGVLYFAATPDRAAASTDWEIWRASPEDGPADLIARLDGSRAPVSPLFVQGTLSLDGTSIALPLLDGATTNVWALPTAGGDMRPLTDFDGRTTVIARSVSWSPAGDAIYAAVADVTADIVLYESLI